MAPPIFEGSEKRLEVDFLLSQETQGKGLRCLSRQQLDGLLDKVCDSIWLCSSDQERSSAKQASLSSLLKLFPQLKLPSVCDNSGLTWYPLQYTRQQVKSVRLSLSLLKYLNCQLSAGCMLRGLLQILASL